MADIPGGDSKADYSFGQIAIRENYCTFEQVKECLDIQNKLRSIGLEPKRLGEILIEKGYLKPEQAAAITKIQVQGTSTQRISIPGYEILSRIGQGAMGSVFKGRQISMDRIVAIKVLSPRYSRDKSYVERFIREARAVAKLRHENIISGFDVGEAGGIHYFVMEYVEGTPVSTLLRREGRLSERRCLEIGLQVARALSHAHKNGIVHRDVKPENIMITASGVAKLCDLGLAKQIKDQAGATMDGMSVGTPNYISPEQARGEENIDIRTDIYSLGASLYHMATGTPPFTGANAMVVMTKHVTEFPDPPKKRNPALSDDFNGLVMKMMEKRREDRFQDPDAVIAEIERLLRAEPPAARWVPAAPPETAPTRPRIEPPLRPITHVPRRSPAPSSFPALPLFLFGGLLAVAAIALFLAGGFSSSGGRLDSSGAPPPPPPPPEPKEADPRQEILAFRAYVDSRILNPEIPDRFTAPFEQIHERIEHYKARSKFEAQQAWEEELPQYLEKVNSLINTRIWADIEKRVREHYEAGRHAKALEELGRLEEVYKWFRKGDRAVPTEAGKAHAEWTRKILRESSETYVTQKRLAEEAFRDPARRDEAYRLLDGLAASVPPPQRGELEAARRAFLEREIQELLPPAAPLESLRRARDRFEKLRAMHAGNAEVQALLDRVLSEVRDREQKILGGAVSRATQAYLQVFAPKFSEAMKQRDLAAARRAAHALLFSPENASLQPAFFAGGADGPLLKVWLEPARAGDFPRLPDVLASCEAEARKGGALQDFFLDLRVLALLEDLVEQALRGVGIVSREPEGFKTGYSAALRDAVSVEPLVPRRPDRVALLLTVRQGAGTASHAATLAPRSGLISEDDIVALARKAAPADALHPIKAFLLHFYADRTASAKVYWDQLTTPELRLGIERYAEKFRGMASRADEEAARKLYEQAVNLYVRKKDTAGGIRLFRECLEKYAGTEYLKGRGPLSPKTRLDLIREILGAKPQGAAPAGPARREA